jgi:D-glycero-alpha-D-manno-heptose 1-phosphate guanylyltransferase
MIKEAIILAGGLGTRLRSAVPELPKCMAPVAGKPFIDYVLHYLAGQGISRFILALGYQSQVIEQHIHSHFADWDIVFSREEEPLGTGGAIALACQQVQEQFAVVTNGDTLYKAVLQNAFPCLKNDLDCLLFLKPMQAFDRYGAVEIANDQRITSFKEKQFVEQGLINGGLYLLNIPRFLKIDFPQKFSFEKGYLEAYVNSRMLYGITDSAYFIDIGIPEDFERAGRELAAEAM